MIFLLKFSKSDDTLPFEVVSNHDLFRYFVDTANNTGRNIFSFDYPDSSKIEELVFKLHSSIMAVNPILDKLINLTFTTCTDFENYFNQSYLNKTHASWVKAQSKAINIDDIRFSKDLNIATLGKKLHEMYPDEIRDIRIAEALDKLGHLSTYEDINMTIHYLEGSFNNNFLSLSSAGRYDIFDNPFKESMVTNNDVTNFNFGYTYLGRQNYNKWDFFDSNLECDDYYNYETLEFSFNLNLSRPQSIPFSVEFLEWCNKHNMQPVGNQLPVANLVDIEHNLFDYRKIIYRNLKDKNTATIIIEE